MRKFVTHAGCFLICFCTCHVLKAQDFTNKGKDFWIGYGNHVRMFTVPPPTTNCTGNANSCPEKMQVYITSDVNTTGTITIPSVGFSQPFAITANQITTIDIPRTAALPDEGMYDHGIHIVSALPVVVYSFIYVNAISGATLCLPTTVLGREYYSVNYTQLSNENNSYSYFFVVATEDNTTVEIIPANATKAGRPANVPFNVVLNKGQIYQVLGALSTNTTGGDLTGSSIRSINTGAGCKKIAVFSGSGKISIGCTSSAGSSDNLYQQMYPNSSWGKKYITTPTTNTGSNFQTNFYRIIRPDPTATVTLNGTVLPGSFTKNFYYEFSNNTTNVIESDKPVLVAQYFTTSGSGANCGNSGIGDPDMVYINPVEQTIQKVTLNSMQPATNTAITTHFINAVLKNIPSVISSFQIDGVNYGGSFSPVPQDNNYAYARIKVSAGTHNLSCDSGFNAIAYGSGNAESYGYSAGSNLRDLYQFVSIKNEYAIVNFPAGCKNSPLKFAITLPYQPISLKWQFKGLFTDTAINTPVYDSTWVVNGRNLYRYPIDKRYTIPDIGTYPITIIADNPTTDGCSGEQQIDYDLQIFERPSAVFTKTFTGCMKHSAAFFDASDGMGREIIKRFWDFGDGIKDDTSKNPTHIYGAAGNYEAKFAIVTDVGCLSDTMKMKFSAYEHPVVAFSSPAIKCVTRSVTFADNSTINGGSITKWYWRMGDGSFQSVKNPVHTYAATGNYPVSLQVESDKGCQSDTLILPAIITDLPKASFGTPEVCVSDAFAVFSDSSSIADKTEAEFSYLWNFGDASAIPANPNTATSKNPQHKFTQAADFNIRLTVTSKDGCADDTTVVFTVNGAIPKADFAITNTGNLCSNLPVSVTDKSTVDFGKITRLEIYWDYQNDPTRKTVDEQPAPGKVYSFAYPEFGLPSTRDFQINYIAYSGINCLNPAVRTITLHATPQLAFDPIPAICAEAPAFAIIQTREINSIQGTALYSGPGITNKGVLTPRLAATGLNTIRYRFTTPAGCTSFKDQTVEVYPTPSANAGPDGYLLEGKSVTITATATGKSLSYEWTPAAYLDKNTILTPSTSAPSDMNYKLTVTSADGCKASDEMHITLLKEVKVPNAFSPNGDGINDFWELLYLKSYPGCEVEVFNRYGQKVFQSTGYGKPWDGRLNGIPLPFGTYYWIIRPKNGREPMNGSVTIIR